MDNYLIEIEPIADEVILATDPDTGAELLRFGVQVGGRWVKAQFPRFGEYPDFLNAVSEILILFTDDDSNIEFPEDFAAKLLTQSQFVATELIRLKAALLVRKADIGKKVLHTFFKYLRPEVELDDTVLTGDKAKGWILDNAAYDMTLNLFAACLLPEELLKKKSILTIQKGFPNLVKLLSFDTSPKKLDGTKPPSDAPASFGFD